jgi:hypothetical protein
VIILICWLISLLKERERIDATNMLVGVMDGDTDGTLTYGEVAATPPTTEGTLYIDLIDAKKKRTSVGRSRCRVSNSKP